MQEQYNPTLIEKNAQKYWAQNNVYRVIEHAKNKNGQEKPKFYACSMLPYPSGKLHMGHVRNYTINDMMARQLRMRGYNVLMPMGWDAFGMPAENAAILSKVPPAKWTYDNIDYMKKQMNAMGLAIDWEREMCACDPDYYRWNQWFFLKMLEKGIAYRKTQIVNWDPIDNTVLANEQVVDGRGWRSGALVEKREIPGYYLKITDYAEELLDAVKNDLDGWPDRVRSMQENWLGRSEGVRFAFTHTIKDEQGKLIQDGKMYVFTTRADTIMGVTFCAVAPEHPLALEAARHQPQVADFIASAQIGGTTEADIAAKEKEGIATGLYVTHPLTQEKIEVWVGNYVLMSYGDGAVMGVPAHDERDFAFANKYSLPIKQVISIDDLPYSTTEWQDWYANKDNGILINSKDFDGLSTPQAIEQISYKLEENGQGKKQITWRIRDWGISRQRYWGTPIPIIHCPDCGAVPVPEEDLPVKLPENLIPDGSGNPLNKCEEFIHCQCPKCGQDARRETDTMDTFVDSSWYFMRYASANNPDQMVDERNDYWMPMDQYIGGIEHAVMHLLYARFWTKVMRDMGLVKFSEPFKNLLCQGMVLNHVYSRRDDKGFTQYFWPHEVKNIHDEKGSIISAELLSDGSTINYGGISTMSKSKNNGIDPQSLIETLGADTARLFIMFASPPEQTLEWSDTAVDGAHRFLKRVWNICFKNKELIQNMPIIADWSQADKATKALRLATHQILKQAQYDFERIQYNTVVSAGMKLLNELEDFEITSDPVNQAAFNEAISILLRLLYPVVPHITWQLWNDLSFEQHFDTLLDAPWPEVDEAALITDEVELMLQINGKLRGSIMIPNGASKEAIEEIAKSHDSVAKFIGDRAIKRVIIVPSKLVNIVG